MSTQTAKINGAPSAVGSEGNASYSGSSEDKYPALCMLCFKRVQTFHEAGHPDDGMDYLCGLMVEKMETGMGLTSCNYRESIVDSVVASIRANQEAHGTIDADIVQAAAMARQAEAEIQRGPFADAEPFDAGKFVTDVIGS
jgi:hypothetical protein